LVTFGGVWSTSHGLEAAAVTLRSVIRGYPWAVADVRLAQDRAAWIADLLECLADLIDLPHGSVARRAARNPAARADEPVQLTDIQMKLLSNPPAGLCSRDRGRSAELLREYVTEIRGQLGPDATRMPPMA
jgi:hypothetical protein